MQDFRNIAAELYRLLDEIDTASDMAKGDDQLYRGIVKRVVDKRFKYHSLFDPDGDVSKFNQPPS